MPYAVKDIFKISDRLQTCRLTDGSGVAIVDESDLLRCLDQAGAERVGSTNMTELAYEPSGYNASRGRVINSWNIDYVAGGSSSGSAAAVATGAVAVAIGSDTVGSLRISDNLSRISKDAV